jgi:hypothetical protein
MNTSIRKRHWRLWPVQGRPEIGPRKKRKKEKGKEFRKADGEGQRPIKKYKDYNFTPLNAEISEVLMEIKRDLEFRRPPKIPDNPPQKNKGKYCDFHE